MTDDDGGGGGRFTRHETRFFFRTPNVKTSGIRFLYGNWFATGGTFGELPGRNAITIANVIEFDGRIYPMTFGGERHRTLQPGEDIINDPFDFEFPPNSDVGVATDLTVPPGGFGVRGQPYYGLGSIMEQSISSNAPESQIDRGGNLSLPPGGAVDAPGFGPIAMLGHTSEPWPSVGILGDSIGFGASGLSDRRANVGFLQKGLWEVNGGAIPQIRLARGGDRLERQTPGWSPKRLGLLRYCTDLICQSGTNDIGGDPSLETLQGACLQIWSAAQQHGVRTTRVKVAPRVLSTNQCIDPAGQNYFNGSPFTPGGLRDQFNSWIDSKFADGTLAAIIDPNVYWEDRSDPCKWVTDGTAHYPTRDGTHPAEALHKLARPLVTQWAETLFRDIGHLTRSQA